MGAAKQAIFPLGMTAILISLPQGHFLIWKTKKLIVSGAIKATIQAAALKRIKLQKEKAKKLETFSSIILLQANMRETTYIPGRIPLIQEIIQKAI